MRNPLSTVRPEERRDVFAAFLSLFFVLTAHAILETARDALFLARIPAEELPWVYLGIAGVSLFTVRIASAGQRGCRRSMLSLLMAAVGAVTVAFWAVLPSLGDGGLYALYIWSGVAVTLVLVQFWLLVADLFTVTQAKRLFGVIGVGSVLGAIAGSAVASGLAQVTDARDLLLASAAMFVVASAFPPWTSLRRSSQGPIAPPVRPLRGALDDLAFILRRPYARLVAALVLITAVTVTGADFVFKRLVRESVAAPDLDAFLALFYLAVNAAALLAQLVTGWVTRRFTVVTALGLLPLLFAGSGLGVVLFGGLGAAMVLRGADGTLRHSLNRTATELLYVPMREGVRERVKSFVDVLGQRGGQALASLVILALVAAEASDQVVGVALVAFTCVWLYVVVRLRAAYVDLFRRQISRDTLADSDFPALDLASIEALVAALDSDHDAEVVAALDLLEGEQKTHLVPALILHHPSEDVVVRALELFIRAERADTVRVIDRILDHPAAGVRAAAIAARSLLRPNEQRVLQLRLSTERDARVRAAIMVNLIASGEIPMESADDSLEALYASDDVGAKRAPADAIGLRSASRCAVVLERLAEDRAAEVRAAAARAMGALRAPEHLPILIALLATEATRSEALDALQAYGAAAHEALLAALDDAEGSPREVRWQIPRALAHIDPRAAAPQLLRRLASEREGMVRYRMIRALERISRDAPDVRLDQALILESIGHALRRAHRALAQRRALERGVEATPERRTPGHDLLVRVLRGKQQSATDRLLRLLGLTHPGERFEAISRALHRGTRTVAAGGLELLDNLLRGPHRDAALALFEPDLDDDARIARAGAWSADVSGGYDALIATMIDGSSRTLRGVAIYHAGELELAGIRDRIERAEVGPAMQDDRQRALDRLRAA